MQGGDIIALVCIGLGLGFLWVLGDGQDAMHDQAHGDVVELHPEAKVPAARNMRAGDGTRQAAEVTLTQRHGRTPSQDAK